MWAGFNAAYGGRGQVLDTRIKTPFRLVFESRRNHSNFFVKKAKKAFDRWGTPPYKPPPRDANAHRDLANWTKASGRRPNTVA